MSVYFEKVLPAYIESWPKALCSLSIAQVDVPLTTEEANNLESFIKEFGVEFKRTGNIEGIVDRVEEAVNSFPDGAFVRLGSRSPKDHWCREEQMRSLSGDGKNPLRFMLECSERMYEDLKLAITNNHPPHIFVRQWMFLNKHQEFRCFMRNRKLVGISQYYYHDPYEFIADNKDSIQWAIETFFESEFKDACHLDDVVFDVFVKYHKRGSVWVWEVRLLEINPFFEMTDPCLFDWRNGGSDFDGSFRFTPFKEYHGK